MTVVAPWWKGLNITDNILDIISLNENGSILELILLDLCVIKALLEDLWHWFM